MGEVCHFVDLLSYFVGASPSRVYGGKVSGNGDAYYEDTVVATLNFDDGSVGNISYISFGDKTMTKERIELFRDGSVCIIDDFRTTQLHADGSSKTITAPGKSRGHAEEIKAFVSSIIKGEPPPVPFRESVISTLATLKIVESLEIGEPVALSGDPLSVDAL